jgi:hypothetical protein
MTCGGCGGEPRRVRGNKTKVPKADTPVEKPDGSLLYIDAAPRRDGYTHDPKNPRRLIVDKAPCVYRITAPLLNSDGSMKTLNQCNCPSDKKRGQNVNEEICEACPSRPK